MKQAGMNAMSNRFAEIGERLRAYRMGRGLAAEQVAERLGVSRAAVYRIEAGEVVKIETLDRLANVLETSVGSLLGLGVEYYANAISYFERMRQIEEKSEQVIAHFPPLSYLLTSENYSQQLKQTLMEAAPSYAEDGKDYEAEIDTIVAVLDERKHARHRRHLSVVNFVNMPEIERWLKLGLVGRFDLAPNEIVERRLAARAEIEHLIKLIEHEPMGIQIGLIEEPLPNITFQLFRTSERTLLGLSPFRLGGELPNIRTGVAMLTADEEPVRLYEQLVERLWRRAHKGREAAQQLRMILERSAMKSAGARKAS
jgi:transcriptional regulator with XRE-family HTH domain